MFFLLHLQNIDLGLLQSLGHNFDGMSYTTSEHEQLKSDILKSSLGFVTGRDVQHIVQLYLTLFYLFLTVNLMRKSW